MTLIRPLHLILVVSLITILPLARPGFFKSHDGELHLARIVAFSNALKNGQFPVRWAANLNYGYGYPIFNFVYPFPYIISSAFYLCGLPLELSLKAVLGLSMIISAIFMFKAAKIWLENEWAAFLAGTLYLLAPYRFLNTYVRVALGEAVAFIFPPLIIYGFLIWQKKEKVSGWFLMILSIAGLILSHNALSIIFLGFLGLFFILESKRTMADFLWTILGVILGLGLSAFFWLPALTEIKYTLAKYYLSQKDFHDYFVSFKNLIYMPWGFTKEATPTFLGVENILVIILFTWQMLRKKIDKARGLFLLSFLLISVFFMNKISVFFWEKIPVLPFFQIPWRFLAATTLTITLMGGLLIKSLKKQSSLLVFLMLFFLLIFSLPRIKVYAPQKIDNDFYLKYPKSTTWHNEGTPLWTSGEADHYPLKPIELEGPGEVKDLVKKETKHTFTVNMESKGRIIDNTVYFPGWQAWVDNEKVPIEFQDPNFRGLITFNVASGAHRVVVIFGKTKLRLISEVLSIISLFTLFLIIFSPKIKREIGFMKL